MKGAIRTYVRVTDRISDLTGYAAASLIFYMGAVLIFDAFTRNVIKMPVSWAIEMTQFTLTAYYFLGGPITLKNNDHVRMDLWYSHMTEKGQAKMDLLTVGCLIFFLSVMLWGAISSLEYAIATGERRFSMWNPSVIPIKVLMVICLVLMLLQAVALVFKHIATIRGESLE